MDNVGIVVESLDTAIAFFAELGLEPEGRTMIEGEWAGIVAAELSRANRKAAKEPEYGSLRLYGPIKTSHRPI